jgi:hypothetical protein
MEVAWWDVKRRISRLNSIRKAGRFEEWKRGDQDMMMLEVGETKTTSFY